MNSKQPLSMKGEKFGRLLVTDMVPGGRGQMAVCRCDCGNEVTALAYNVRRGNTSSCGCAARELHIKQGAVLGSRQGKLNATHGRSGTSTYASWHDAKVRCYSPKSQSFRNYGAKGIGMCDRWRNSFANFLSDMGERPPGMTLERKDGTKDYEPGNCEWASREVQAQNRPGSVKLSPDSVRALRARHAAGESQVSLAREYGVQPQTISRVIRRTAWRNIKP